MAKPPSRRPPIVLVPPSLSPTPKPKGQCSYPGCTTKAVTKGECFKHYQQRRRAAIKATAKGKWRPGEEPSEYARTVPLEERRRAASVVMQLAGLV